MDKFEINEFAWTSYDTLHEDLTATKNLVYDPCQFNFYDILTEDQNSEYGAYIFKLNTLLIRFRVAKTTPTKVGQFVTFWQRDSNGLSIPYDVSDPTDLFVISAKKGNNFGQFIFPKYILCNKNIVSKNGKGGKRGIRVYPPWDKPTSLTAQKTQEWQLQYFLEIPINMPLDFNRAKVLYNQHIIN